MAVTRQIAMHINKGKTAAQCLRERIGYCLNPLKTGNGKWVSSYRCEPQSADLEFALSKREYAFRTGRAHKNEVIAYMIRQSFLPGEITPEEANRIGYETVLKWTKGRYAFLVATHVDKEHIHSHIIFNSTALDGNRKFRDFLGSGMALQKLSDRICLEAGLSIIENPKRGNHSYGKWLGDRRKLSNREELQRAIDEALANKPADFDVFLQFMDDMGYRYKAGRQSGFIHTNWKKCVRFRSLPDEYSEAEILACIVGKHDRKPIQKQRSNTKATKASLIIDIQAKLQSGKGAGYEQWAKVFNLKQAAHTLNYLSENSLLEYAALAQKAQDASSRYHALSDQIKVLEKQLAETAILRTHIHNYIKTRDTYVAYRKAGYAKAFLAAYESDILLHKAAKKAFDALDVKKLPTIMELQSRYASLLREKKAVYSDFVKVRNELREVQIVKANVDRLLGKETRTKEVQAPENKREKGRYDR